MSFSKMSSPSHPDLEQSMKPKSPAGCYLKLDSKHARSFACLFSSEHGARRWGWQRQLLGTCTGCSPGACGGCLKTRTERVFKNVLERAAARTVRPGAVRASAGSGGGAGASAA